MKRPKLLFTSLTGAALLAGSSYFLVQTFGSTLRGASQFSKFPVQSEFFVSSQCFDDNISIIPGIAVSQSQPALWISISISEADITESGCETINVSSQRFSFEDPVFFSGLLHDAFGYLGARPSPDALRILESTDDGYGTNNVTFAFQPGKIQNQAFIIQLPTNGFLTQTDFDMWAFDTNIMVENASGGLSGWPHFSFIMDDDLSILETNIVPIVQLDPEDVRVYRSDLETRQSGPGERLAGRFRLDTQDRDARVWRDISIFLASTIFGASISVLIECFLSLELYRIFVREKVGAGVLFKSLRRSKTDSKAARRG